MSTGASPPPDGTVRHAILLVDHGSARAEANDAVLAVARLLAALAPDTCVEAAHMDVCRPDIAAGIAACAASGARDIVVLPWMLAPGRHWAEDVPRQVSEALERHPGIAVRVARPLGVDRRLAALALDRVEECRRESAPLGAPAPRAPRAPRDHPQSE